MAQTSRGRRLVVCPVNEFPPGTRRIVEVDGRSIGVFNVDGAFYALRNRCPHQGGPLCRGTLTGTMLPSKPREFRYGMANRILRCPWHNWEFDLHTGEVVFVPARFRVKTYPVVVETAGDRKGRSVETYAVSVEERHVVLYC